MRLTHWLFLLLLPLLGRAQTPGQANKQLFDRTIDELNFRTFETVYDRHFTRQKFPNNLRTATARRQFSNFENNAELQKAFLNYNDGAERYKTRFGKGPLTLAEFEKQLNSVLRDRNFEFFIRGLSRDERTALVRTEQRAIKQATAQFNASGAPISPTAEPEEPLAATVPLTTHGPGPGSAENKVAEAPVADLHPAAGPAPPAGSGPGWVSYGTLLLSLGSFLLLLYAAAGLLPELRRLRARLRALEAEQVDYGAPPEGEMPNADAPPAAPAPSFFSRFRPQATDELPDDKYGDEPN